MTHEDKESYDSTLYQLYKNSEYTGVWSEYAIVCMCVLCVYVCACIHKKKEKEKRVLGGEWEGAGEGGAKS